MVILAVPSEGGWLAHGKPSFLDLQAKQSSLTGFPVTVFSYQLYACTEVRWHIKMYMMWYMKYWLKLTFLRSKWKCPPLSVYSTQSANSGRCNNPSDCKRGEKCCQTIWGWYCQQPGIVVNNPDILCLISLCAIPCVINFYYYYVSECLHTTFNKKAVHKPIYIAK